MYPILQTIPADLRMLAMHFSVIFIVSLLGFVMLSMLDRKLVNGRHFRLEQARRLMGCALLGFVFIILGGFYNPDSFQIFPILANICLMGFIYQILESGLPNDEAMIRKSRQAFAGVAVVVLLTLLIFARDSLGKGFRVNLMNILFTMMATGSILMQLKHWKTKTRVERGYAFVWFATVALFVAHMVTYDTSVPYESLASISLLIILPALIGFLLLATLSVALDSLKTLKDSAHTDWLTGLFNRRYFYQHIPTLISLTNRQRSQCALMMIDIDNFKDLNDTHGHELGDKVLKEFSNTLRRAIRDHDVPFRWGGEEFLIVLPMTNLPEAQLTGQRLLQHIRQMTVPHMSGAVSVTASAGVTSVELNENLDDAIERADQYLYGAKAAGKDCLLTSLELVPSTETLAS